MTALPFHLAAYGQRDNKNIDVKDYNCIIYGVDDVLRNMQQSRTLFLKHHEIKKFDQIFVEIANPYRYDDKEMINPTTVNEMAFLQRRVLVLCETKRIPFIGMDTWQPNVHSCDTPGINQVHSTVIRETEMIYQIKRAMTKGKRFAVFVSNIHLRDDYSALVGPPLLIPALTQSPVLVFRKRNV